jgi:hypothetical protein
LIKPIARTELSEYRHIGPCGSGSARIWMRQSAELLIEAGRPATNDNDKSWL